MPWRGKTDSLDTRVLTQFAAERQPTRWAPPLAIYHALRQRLTARDALREIPIKKLIEICAKAGDLYLNAKLPLGDGTQSPSHSRRQRLYAVTERADHFWSWPISEVAARLIEVRSGWHSGLDLRSAGRPARSRECKSLTMKE